MTGETVGQSLARLRIEASKDLLASAADVTDVALAAGFATPQSFARAFRRETGQSPTAWRAGERLGDSPSARANGPIEIVRRDAVTVVALRRDGQAYTELNDTFGAVWGWAEEAGILGNLQGIYGLPLDDPQSVPVDQLRYAAALALGAADPPPPFQRLDLASGRYARMRHCGSYDGLQGATQALVVWLLVSGEEPADAPIIHQFLNDPEETPEADLLTDILLPLQDKAAE